MVPSPVQLLHWDRTSVSPQSNPSGYILMPPFIRQGTMWVGQWVGSGWVRGLARRHTAGNWKKHYAQSLRCVPVFCDLHPCTECLSS